jgi:hypothetical protein
MVVIKIVVVQVVTLQSRLHIVTAQKTTILSEICFLAEGEAIWHNVVAERLRRNSLNPVVVYCSQTLNPSVRVSNTKETVTNNSTSNNSTSNLATASDKKFICTVVSKLKERSGILKSLCISQCQNTNY